MNQKFKTSFIALITFFITCSLIVFPEQSLEASIRGLHTWWEIVFPSLLPFFITAELLISFGVVQFAGILLEPIMRPLFNVPGAGSFAWMLGMVSGYPSGAKIGVLLREKKEISRIEAERLVSFSNASSPLFIFGAIAVGFFHDAKLGIFIAICHYGSNILVGICMRFYGKNKENNGRNEKIEVREPIFVRALKKMHHTRINDDRPFGQVIGDAVVSSIQTLLMIGGFIILFSVFTTLLQVINVSAIVQFVITPVLLLFNIPLDITKPLFTGLFEVTIGSELISKLQSIPLVIQLATVSFLLGFNGFSIQAQVASIIAKTDIRFYPYFIARIMHATFAAIFTVLLFHYFYDDHSSTATFKFDHPFVTQIGEFTLHPFILQFYDISSLITTGAIIVTIFILCKRLLKNAT